uniref:SFRICE_010924 n=1 Tax=Spodoptera frugiperda TaxID=7108 RepID=A0A2H1VME6_SPOFR
MPIEMAKPNQLRSGKRADISPDRKQSPPPVDILNTRGVTTSVMSTIALFVGPRGVHAEYLGVYRGTSWKSCSRFGQFVLNQTTNNKDGNEHINQIMVV